MVKSGREILEEKEGHMLWYIGLHILILHRAGFFSVIQPLHRRHAIVPQQLQPTQSPDTKLTARGILAWD